MLRSSLVLSLMLFGCQSPPDTTVPETRAQAQPVSGSCQTDAGDACGAQSPDGCYCDELCTRIGDCCEDYAPVCIGPQPCTGEATYEVVFNATWDPANVPNPHWSPLIGATHDADTHLWSLGGIATPGIEVMAETGNPNPLRGEVEDLIAVGSAGEVVSDGAVPDSPGTSDTMFTATAAYPYVTLTTMVAPSPDWFVGVDAQNLCNDDGTWADEIVVDMTVYDAGTDSGTWFTSSNNNTSPKEPISQDTPFATAGALTSAGTMTFTRL